MPNPIQNLPRFLLCDDGQMRTFVLHTATPRALIEINLDTPDHDQADWNHPILWLDPAPDATTTNFLVAHAIRFYLDTLQAHETISQNPPPQPSSN